MANTFSIDAEQLRSLTTEQLQSLTTTTLPITGSVATLSIDDYALAIRRRCMVCDMEIPAYNTYPLCDECRHRIYDMIYGSRNAFDGYAFFDGHIWEEEDK